MSASEPPFVLLARLDAGGSLLRPRVISHSGPDSDECDA